MLECKKASLTIKTASGIKPFQESKRYEKWLSFFLPLIQSRVSCLPEQALDPNSGNRKCLFLNPTAAVTLSVSPCWSSVELKAILLI